MDSLLFNKEIDAYVKRRELLQENKQRVYSLILGQCTELLKTKLKSSKKWLKISTDQDVLLLLEEIKSILFKFEDKKYLPLAIYQSKKAFFSFKQGDLTNSQFLDKFNNLVDIATSFDGNLHDHAIVELVSQEKHKQKYEQLTDEQKKEVEEAAKEKFLATSFLACSDPRRYGTLLENLENNHTMKDNKYPQDMVMAFQFLNEFKQWKPRYQSTDAQGLAFAQGQGNSTNRSNRRGGGNSNNNNNNNNKSDSGDKGDSKEDEVTCYRCGKKGYKTPDCPNCQKDKKDTNDDEDKSKGKKKNQGKNVTFTQDDHDSNSEDNFGFLERVAHANLGGNKLNLRNYILLDNQSTSNAFCNKNLLSDIHDCGKTMTLHSNGGSISTSLKGTLKGFGEVWYNPDYIANILCLKDVVKKFRATYDSEEDSRAFVVHRPHKADIRFDMHHNGLHLYNVGLQGASFVETTQERSEGYSKRQVAAARAARNLYAKVGFPSLKDFKTMISNNMLQNCPISIEDINHAEDIYGPSIASLKGKTTRKTPPPVITDYMTIPKEILFKHPSVTLAGDVFFVNKIPFFVTLSRHIKFGTVQHLSISQCSQGIKKVLLWVKSNLFSDNSKVK